MFNAFSGNEGKPLLPLGEGTTTRRLSGSKCSMAIHLDNHFTNRIYNSSSSLSGHVKIDAFKETPFDKIQILFLGTSKTRMEGVRGPHTTAHTFLKLEMPISASSYPARRIYKAGQTYSIPFNFIVPNQLTINACNHNIDSAAVHDSHLCLPPSLGPWSGKDDFSPEMARVEYTVIARVLAEEDDNGKRAKILEDSHPVRVLPTHDELPPLHITPNDKLYKMSKTKTLRKSLLTGKIGKVTLTARQPGAIMLSPDATSASTTKVHIDLVFDPTSSHSLPPSVTGTSSKITAVTYYSAGAINGFPNMGDWIRAFGAESRGSYPSSTTLAASHVESFRWRQNIRLETRRGSTLSTNTVSTDGTDWVSDTERSGHGSDLDRRRGSKDSTKELSPVYHTASLQVPVELPVNKKMFVPSFHSCVMSRVYVLWITISLSCNGNNSNIMLGVPLQVGVQSTEPHIDQASPPSFETAIEEAAADDHLRPRTFSVPNVHFENHALPGYADLIAGRMVVAN
ncbi:putative Arrestin [Seiridium cardinale]|uniref:Arrestin n=1 Tax=Seiridium cardinale TaxID=138064 RepID=A0ABR2XXG7_9PEZI